MSLMVRLLVLALWVACVPAWSQSSSPSPSATPVEAVVAVPLAEFSSASVNVTARLRDIETQLNDDALFSSLQQDLATFTSDVDLRLREDTRALQSHPDIEALRAMETVWQSKLKDVGSWKKGLTSRLAQSDQQIAELEKLQAIWNKSREVAQSPDMPQGLSEMAKLTTASITRTLQLVRERQKLLVGLQNSVSQQEARIEQGLGAVTLQRSQVVTQALIQDSPPLWSRELHSRLSLTSIVGEMAASWMNQTQALSDYLENRSGGMLGTLFIFLLVVLLLRRSSSTVAQHEQLKPAMVFMEHRLMTALLVALVFGRTVDPTAPRLLQASLAALVLLPAVVLMRRLVDQQFWPLLNALLVFSLFDQMRVVATPVPLLSRLILLVESVGGLLFLTWTMRGGRMDAFAVRWPLRMAWMTFLAVSLACVAGFTSLAYLLANGFLGAAYLGVVFSGSIKVVEALLLLATWVRPLSSSRMVSNYGDLVRANVMRLVRGLLLLAWMAAVLDLFSVRETVLGFLRTLLQGEFGVGSLSLTLGRLISFALIMWVGRLISRFLRFTAQEEIFPLLSLGQGAIYAVSMGIHYTVGIFSLVLALAALGIDTTKFAVVAGALSVGIGFGLQNIVNNFVSGLILLLDRPVNVGDVIKIGEFQGRLGQIGLRSSTLIIGDGSEVIIPNSDLINQRVVNWTRKGIARRMNLRFYVGAECSASDALALMIKVAGDCPGVASFPTPEALHLGYSGKLQQLQLECWVMDQGALAKVRSDLTMRIKQGLGEAGFDVSVSR